MLHGPPPQAQPLADSEVQEAGGGRGGRSWWQWTDTGPDGRPSRALHYTGWEQGYQVLTQVRPNP